MFAVGRFDNYQFLLHLETLYHLFSDEHGKNTYNIFISTTPVFFLMSKAVNFVSNLYNYFPKRVHSNY